MPRQPTPPDLLATDRAQTPDDALGLAIGPQVMALNIADVRLDGGTQPRAGISPVSSSRTSPATCNASYRTTLPGPGPLPGLAPRSTIMTMPINPPTPTHAFISQTTFAVLDGDGKETMLPGVFTANHWQDGGMEIYIQPIGALHCNIAQITVLIDHQDLAHVNALLHAQDRAQAAPTHPSDPSDPSDCYDCRTIDQRLAELADKLSRVDGRMLARLDALEAAATPAIANRAWMTEIERRLDDLVLQAVSETTHVALVKRVAALEQRLAEIDELAAEAREEKALADDTLLTVDMMAVYDMMARRERAQDGA